MSDATRARYIAALASYDGGEMAPLWEVLKDPSRPRVLDRLARAAPMAIEKVVPSSNEWRMLSLIGMGCAASVAYAHPPVTLCVGDGLSQLLSHTDIDWITADDIRMPYRVVAIRIPAELTPPGYNNLVGLAMRMLIHDTLTDDPPKMAIAVEWIVESGGDHLSFVDYVTNLRGYIDDDTSSLLNGAMRFLLGALLYMQSKGAAARIGGRDVALDRDVVVLPPIRSAGRIGGRAVQALRARDGVLGPDIRRVRANTIVRGHFRRQACGPRHQERRVIWIRPHLRYADETHPVLGRDVEAVAE